ncbi:hypothetical protein OROGR_032202 [Orobanche gracilis]
MSCKKHPDDFSSNVGVCACCLRDRLFAIMSAQAQQEHRKSDIQQPTPLSFPRSVSPYISRRKSDTNAATWQIHGSSSSHQRFYSTPFVGPTGSAQLEMKKDRNSSLGRRFSSLILGLFRSESNKSDLDLGPVSDPGDQGGSCSTSPSWFSSVIPGRRENQIRTSSLDEGATRSRRSACWNRERGMSPAKYPEDEDDEHCRIGSRDYPSESSQGWRHTPRRTLATGPGVGRGAGHGRNVSGLVFCLSPLVRPSPNRHWNQKGVSPEMAVSGESTVPPKAHLPAAAAFCKNRSRKLADFGRYKYKYNTNH